MKRFRLSKLAEADLDEMWLYVAGDRGVDVADRLLDDVMDRIVLLARHPKAGRRRDELAVGLRSFPVKSHIIYYRREPSHILIARVLHGSRDQPSAALGNEGEGLRSNQSNELQPVAGAVGRATEQFIPGLEKAGVGSKTGACRDVNRLSW